MEYSNRSRDSHSQHRDCNKLCLVIVLTERLDIYRYKTTLAKHTNKNKLDVGELPPLLEN